MSAETVTTTFLDPRVLLESSRPVQLRIPTWPLLGVVLLGLIVLSSNSDNPTFRAIQFAVIPMIFLIAIGLTIFRLRLSRRASIESDAVATLDELIQLRRWPEAAEVANRVLRQPMLLPDRRVVALMGLASLLSRYHRFAEARMVHDALLEPEMGDPLIDPTLAHSVKVARAMAMLREDHLVDADRAMSDLRREVNQARDDVRREQGSERADKVQSGGVILLDLYRDVKTGHPQEAIDIFNRAMPALRDQLGVRVADAWLFAAAAYHAVSKPDEAQKAYHHATTLVPPMELHRRYPETAHLAQTYTKAEWPVQ